MNVFYLVLFVFFFLLYFYRMLLTIGQHETEIDIQIYASKTVYRFIFRNARKLSKNEKKQKTRKENCRMMLTHITL